MNEPKAKVGDVLETPHNVFCHKSPARWLDFINSLPTLTVTYRWNWVEEDQELPQAPVAWETRYGKKLWSKI